MEMTATTGSTIFLKNLAYTFPALLLGLTPESYMILTAFMVFDLFLGILRAVVLGGGAAFKSYKLAAGIVSKFLVLIVPLILVWTGRGAGFDFTLLAQWGIGALIISQAYSMLGHINAIRVGEDKNEWDAVSWILGRLRSALEAILIDHHSKEQ